MIWPNDPDDGRNTSSDPTPGVEESGAQSTAVGTKDAPEGGGGDPDDGPASAEVTSSAESAGEPAGGSGARPVEPGGTILTEPSAPAEDATGVVTDTGIAATETGTETQSVPEEGEDVPSREGEDAVPGPAPEETGALIAAAEMERLQERWRDLKASFVDDPHKAVEDADALVGEAIDTLRERFDSRRGAVAGAWGKGETDDTESLRVALLRYRQLFDSLLHA